MQWNRDENGNPMSWHIPLEVQQISPTHGVIQLVQVPDQHQRVKIVTEENIKLTEVFNIEDIVLDSFYVDYGVGIVRFHESQRGKLVKVDYYGRGVILISDSRIFHRDGENVADTWDNILDRSKDALDLIESAGGLVGAMKEIDKKIEQGEATADRLENFITETQFYGYTITLSREAFVVKAKESGEVGKTEISTVYTDVIVYKGAKQIVPVLSIEQEHGCTFKVDGQRVKLTSMDINVIKANAVLNIDCGDGLVAQRKLEVTKNTLNEIGAKARQLILYNKIDKLSSDKVLLLKNNGDNLFVSAKQNIGIDKLKDKIDAVFSENDRQVKIKLPFSKMSLLGKIPKEKIVFYNNTDDGVDLILSINDGDAWYQKICQFEV